MTLPGCFADPSLDFTPEREFVEVALVASQKNVTGVVRMAVYRGNVSYLVLDVSASY
jgi:argininosuccinate synthase